MVTFSPWITGSWSRNIIRPLEDYPAHNMINIIISLFVGWPGILITVVLSAVGLFKANYRFLVAAAILAFPFSWFLSGFPIIHSPAFLLPLFILGAAFAIYRGHEMIAWVIALPFFLTILFLYYTILVQKG
jgi:hypothetical protein